MKKLLVFFLIFIFYPFSVLALDGESINSTNAIFINLDEDKVLFEKNSDQVVKIASLTKLMTAIVARENISSLDEEVTVLSSDLKGLAENDLVTAGFYAGQIVTYRDLLYGLLLPSGADSAQILARLIWGNTENFVSLMNDKAQELGLLKTHFVNTHGLDAEGHESTVREVAKILEYALKNPDLKEIISSKEYTTSDNYLHLTSTIYNFEKRYDIDLPYMLGGKTGTTDEAGLCLASYGSSNGSNYLLVTTGAKDKVNHLYDAQKIYEYFIDNYENKQVLSINDEILKLNTIDSKEESISFKSSKDLIKYLPKDFTKDEVTYEYQGKENISYKEPYGSKLGTLNIIYDGDIIETIDIILTEEIHFSLLKWLVNRPIIIVITSLTLLLIITITIIVIKKRKK